MNKQPSGRFVLRLPVEVHSALRKDAARLGLSLNELCLRILGRYLKRDQPAGELSASGLPPWLIRIQELLGEALLGVVLFGSVARGEARDGSDIDLLIVVSRQLPLTRRLYASWDEHSADEAHNPHFVHLPSSVTAAGSLWLEAALDGILQYDRDGQVGRFLGQLRRSMASGRLERRVAYGHPYWIRMEGDKIRDQ